MGFLKTDRRGTVISLVLATAFGVSSTCLGDATTLGIGNCSSNKADMNKDDPNKCNHAEMLKAGSDVYKVYAAYNAKKFTFIRCSLESGFTAVDPKTNVDQCKDHIKTYDQLVDEGICIKKLPDGTQESADACLARAKRSAADSEIAAHREILKANKGHEEVLGGKDAKSAAEVFGDPSKAGNTADNVTVTKQLANQFSKDPKDQALFKLAVPQEVSFGDNSKSPVVGDALKSKDQLEKAVIDQDVRGQSSEVGKSGEVDSALSKSVSKFAKDQDAGIKNDQKLATQPPRAPAANNGQQPPKLKDDTRDKLSVDAYASALNDVAKNDPNADKKKPVDLTTIGSDVTPVLTVGDTPQGNQPPKKPDDKSPTGSVDGVIKAFTGP